ncbi:MAG: hypothetical protein AAF542_25830 [Pseudomonadota bacterium]
MIPWFVGALAVYLSFRFIPALRKIEVDGFMSIAFVLVPAILMFFVNLAVDPNFLTLALGLFLAFIVPTLILKNGYSLSWGTASKYALVVVGILFVLEIVLGVLVVANT